MKSGGALYIIFGNCHFFQLSVISYQLSMSINQRSIIYLKNELISNQRY